MLTTNAFEILNHSKANFDSIYNVTDPREYYRILGGLDYVIPELAKAPFRALIGSYRQLRRSRRVRVLDLGCSYGINAALVRYPLDIRRLAGRYASAEMYVLSPDRLCELDGNYFKSWPEEVEADFVGLDSSKSAVDYALRVGLLDFGITSNFELSAPTDEEARQLNNIDLLISTGCVGYITQRTFDRILSARNEGQLPWVANFVLRMFPYEPIAAKLEEWGLITEKLEGITFVQRRFHSQGEFEATLDALRTHGIDPEGKEADGLLHAELFVSRPKEDVRRVPLGEVVSVTSGANRSYGRRYREIGNCQVKLMN